jgi:3-oxoacyl-[acyl-carrier-protein] synthase III
MTVIRPVIIGTGHYLPARIVPNAEFAATLETSDEWIVSRSGIERRHFAAEDEYTSDLAIKAAQAALANAGVTAQEIDAVIVATSTPDYTFPAVATQVQAGLGMTQGFAFDIQAVCAGFVFALANASGLILAGQAKRVLVIGAETFSRIMDWQDRGTCVLFGDGAGAVVLEAQAGSGANTDRGVLACDLHSDGRYRDLLFVDGGISRTGTAGVLRMQGREVFRHAVEKLAATAISALEKAGLEAGKWIGSCRIRPICASSKARPKSWACRWNMWWSRCRIMAIPLPHPSRWRCPWPIARGASNPAI